MPKRLWERLASLASFYLICFCCLCFISCLTTTKRAAILIEQNQGAAYIDSNSEELHFFDDMNWEGLADALNQSLAYYERTRNSRFRVDGKYYNADDMRSALLAFAQIINSELPHARKRELILQNFRICRAAGSDGKGTVVFTGYYEPTLRGSLQKSERYRYPLYSPPPELKTNTTLPISGGGGDFSRRAIDINRVLEGRGLEIAWVEDPVALFFLHIQGSGKLILENGETVRVAFAESNGMPFRSIALPMKKRGLIPNLANAAVQEYLSAHPEEAPEIMSLNERYPFFKINKSETPNTPPDVVHSARGASGARNARGISDTPNHSGATGALAVPLTAGRSIAVDFGLFPKGSLAFIQTALPVFDERGNYKKMQKISRFVFCQDAGAAIKGAGRVDIFFGSGEDAALFANAMKSTGSLYILLKKK